jgi:hypothetical protein
VPIFTSLAKASNFADEVRNIHLKILNFDLIYGIHWCYVRLGYSIGEVFCPDASSLPYVL